MTTPAPVRIPYTNLITNIAIILSPPPFFKMEEMIATPTSYSLLSYVFIVLCFKIGNKDIWMKIPVFKQNISVRGQEVNKYS